jgi:hypothetical protein
MDFSGGGSWVFERLRIPGKDRCTTINGFEVPVGHWGRFSQQVTVRQCDVEVPY